MLLLPSSRRCDAGGRLRQEGGRGDYDGRLSVAGRATVNGKTTTVSKDPSPPDVGVGVVGKSSLSSLPLPLMIAATTIAKEKKGGDKRPPRED